MSFNLNRFQTLSDFTRDNVISEVIHVEGGYVINRNDRGGETNYGITVAVANENKDLWGKYGFNGNMRVLPVELAKHIYVRRYWNACRCDELYKIHPLLAFHVFDLAVNGGQGLVIKHVQETLNVLNRHERDYQDITVDGSIGPGTLNALNAYARRNGELGVKNFIYALGMSQGAFYLSISKSRPRNEEFTNGWIARAASKMKLFAKFLD